MAVVDKSADRRQVNHADVEREHLAASLSELVF